MKKLVIFLMLVCLATMVFADETTTNSQASSLNINISSICWLTLVNGDNATVRTWTIDNSDLKGTGGNNKAIGSHPASLGVYAPTTPRAGDPLSYAVYATDAVLVGGEPDNIANGLRIAVDSNDEDGYTVTLKADANVLTALDDDAAGPHVDETIPVGQISLCSYTGQYDSAVNEFGSVNGVSTPIGTYAGLGGPAAGVTLSFTDAKAVLSTAGEGANVTTVNFALTLYTMDAARTGYTVPITITATNDL